METPASTRRRSGRRTALALVAIATALPLLGTATPSAGAAAPASAPYDPGDSAKFRKLNGQIEQLEKEYGGDLAKLKDAQYAAKKAHNKSKVLEKDLVEARNVVARIAATKYMTNGEDPTVTFLAAADPSELLSNASLVSHMAQNQAAKVEQIQKLVNDQIKARKQAEEKMTQLKAEIKDLKSRQAKIKQLVKKYKPESPSVGMGGVTPRMLKVKNTIDVEFGPFPTIGCVRSTGDPQDHGTGRACDFMVTTGGVMASGSARAQGDQAAQYAISHASALGIKYVIWRQRIYDMRSPGWRSMSNRGGNTANHYDHVHISVF
ncbi:MULTISPECIES: coiled-coil domain-containing protein [unclassified Spirillospora]|uniref:coiled-coil domain-containing protein n=1 Tax=unclassified Spirillospora TaxID=2642701 RepID=UPI00372229EC